jgi:exocyst complex component 4
LHFNLQANYTFGPEGVEKDEAVDRLASDLKNIDLVMVAVLSQDKYRYLFEGVGHLVAAIFISSTNNIKVINTNGIKKM